MYTTKLPKVISAEDLLSTPIPPTKWIIPGLLPAGLALFAGPSKAGKSWLTLWLCLQVAQGKPVWGREVEPRTVLYLSLEEDVYKRQVQTVVQYGAIWFTGTLLLAIISWRLTGKALAPTALAMRR